MLVSFQASQLGYLVYKSTVPSPHTVFLNIGTMFTYFQTWEFLVPHQFLRFSRVYFVRSANLNTPNLSKYSLICYSLFWPVLLHPC